MLKNPRTWLVTLVLVVLAGAGYVVVDRTLLEDDVRQTEVTLPGDPVGSGKDEPARTRVYVDGTGSRVSVSLRTPDEPWTDELVVKLGSSTTTVRRGDALDVRTEPKAPRRCRPTVEARPDSLLTRLSWPAECFGDAERYVARVSVDGAKPVKASGQAGTAPNVLMIMVDDMRTDELQYMPNVQKLIAKKGVTFNNGFAGFPLCCPARASVVTGLYPHNHGVWSHVPPWGFSSLVDADGFPVWLQRAGYHTTYMGKYLNGYGPEPEPGKQSGTSTQYCPAGWDLWRGSIDGGLRPGSEYDGGTYRFFDTTLNNNCNGYISLSGRYQTHAYAGLTVAQIEEDAERDGPSFNYVSFTAPHHGGPHEPDDPPMMVTPARPKRMWGAFDDIIKEAPGADWKDPDRTDKPRRMQMKKLPGPRLKKQMLEAARQRAESLYVVDEAVKRMIDALRRTGQLDDTLVVFTSDNGYALGEQGERQGKILPYEASLRVPVVLRGPGLPKGEVRTDPFLSIDFPVTFADLGDAAVPDVDGISLLDVARLGDDSTDGRWSRVVLTETTPTDAAREALMAQQPVGARQTEQMLGKVTGIRTSRWLYTEWQPEPGARKPGILRELYDMEADPDQYVNLAVTGEHDDLLAAFHELLAQARTCVGASCRDPRLPEKLR